MKPRIIHQYLICLITLFTMGYHNALAQKNDPYMDRWKKVQDFINEGTSKSALEEVDKIYDLAKKEKQDAEVIRALVYKVNLKNENRENNDVLSIHELENEITGSQEPAKSILQSLVAKKYWNYFQQNRWKFYNRTETQNFQKDDVATWSATDFHTKIGAYYLNSIQNKTILQKTSLEAYNTIITNGNSRYLRPTLYDVLTHEALDYFKSDQSGATVIINPFEIKTASAMDPAADFIHQKLETSDTTSNLYIALGLYQDVIAFHINDPKPDALIDIDLERLQFVREHSVHPDKDQQYFLSINHIAHQYGETPAAAQAWYLVAQWYRELANTYAPNGDTTYRFENKKALEIAEKVIKQNPETEGGINAWNLLQSIKNKSLTFSTENVNVPNQPFRMFVEYQNTTKLTLKVFAATEIFNLADRYNNTSDFWKLLKNQKPIKSWEQSLPNTNDYQKHAVEIKVDALPIGEYIIVAGDNSNFHNPSTLLAARQVYVSNISSIQINENIFVLNRETGQPLDHAKVAFWSQKYDYSTRKNINQELETRYTDNKGKVTSPSIPNGSANATLIEITHNKDILFLKSTIGTYGRMETDDDPEEIRAWLFTDRGIYRPGQTVYYKGIVAQGDAVFTDSESEIEVVLEGQNGEEVAKKTLRVNQYGSFSGNFQLPTGQLNGGFTITASIEEEDVYANFSVEEYKRPKFEVVMDTLKGTFKVNEKITVTGSAKAYAGNVIDGARVSYRVVRNPRFAYPWHYKRWFPMSSPAEIAHGETETKLDGTFSVTFEAVPDLKMSEKSNPIFDYQIIADVTDTNGETHSTQTTVSVGYKSLLIKSNIQDKMDLEALDKIAIHTENLNGAKVDSKIQVKFTPLVPEKRLIRKRFWERPDQFVMTKTEYTKLFPNDEYNNETEMATWEVAHVAFDQIFDTEKSQTLDIKNKDLKPGFYKVELVTHDVSGQETRDIRYIEITDPNSKVLNKPAYLVSNPSKTVEPGEKTAIQLGTSAKNIFVIESTLRKPYKEAQFSFFNLNQEKKNIDFKIQEADRGGFRVKYQFVKDNRLHVFEDFIAVPCTNKELNITYETFRDKTLPGSSEKWKVKISGYKKELVAAEMLGSMYDASLDQFLPFQWREPNAWQNSRKSWWWINQTNFANGNANTRNIVGSSYKNFNKSYDQLIGFENYSRRALRGMARGLSLEMTEPTMAMNIKEAVDADKVNTVNFEASEIKHDLEIGSIENALSEVVVSGYGEQKKKEPAQPIHIRKNFNETAFFMPDLHTNKNGEIEFSFNLPDALTRWKFQALAHTKDLAFGYSSKTIITQKELMVQPNAPRFVRQGDQLFFSAKVVNLTDKLLQGDVSLSLKNSTNDQPVDNAFSNNKANQKFTVAAGQSTPVLFPVSVPLDFNDAITWRVTATADNRSDAEENSIPVLSNRLLVTESLPISMNGAGTGHFKFEKLLKSGQSSTLKHQSLTVEYTSNPVWYAVQALPYLMEYPYDCAEQTWNRYYANSMATSIVNSSPKIAEVFQKWQKMDTTALISNLQKNQELKSILLEETPWVLAAKTETEQKKNIALLFDLVKMSNQLSNTIDKLRQLQSSNGGFVWFKGGPDDRYMTQYILSGIGHLQKLNMVPKGQEDYLTEIIEKALPYLDSRIKEDYDRLISSKTDLKKYTPGSLEIQYLYTRSFFPAYGIANASQKAVQYYRERVQQTWVEQSKYMQGLAALALFRSGDKVVPSKILKSLRETAVQNEELGMYWKQNYRGWWWYEAPIERQAIMIEAFQEIEKDTKTVNSLKTWLLKNKQTNSWESTKATAEACYALLMQGTNWLTSNTKVDLQVGSITLNNAESEAGTGYFKSIVESESVKPKMGNITVKITSDTPKSTPPSWGAVYWQYFEDMDKITFAETPLKLSKKLFLSKNTDKGEVLTPVNENDELHVGDKIKVRIELRADRDMEYVHMKDLRASAMEPVNVLSSYKYQDGLGYYETTKDASTNFFFNYLRKGTYVFEYPLFVTHSGDFGNGITTIQCMYTPEFTAHSEGVRVKVK